MAFLDTSVLVQAIAGDPGEGGKARRAAEILSQRGHTLSVQVLQEFYAQATRAGYDPQEATELTLTLTRFTVAPVTVEILQAALVTSTRYGLSAWDAAIIEAARATDCDIVLSDTLADGQDYDGVRVENPFAGLG